MGKIQNNIFNFDLDNDIEDVSISNAIYPTKQKINKDSLQKSKDQSIKNYYETHPQIKVGDILYSNFERNEKGELLNLGNKVGGTRIGICCIQPDFLPDKEARFMANNDFYNEWGNCNKKLPYIDKVLTKSGLRPTGELYSDKFIGGYNDITNDNISNPYLDVNKLNKEWLMPKQWLSDLQGWKNQDIILEYQGISSDFACQSCYNYKTRGTNEGEWYLPAIGELAIAFAKFNVLNKNSIVIRYNSVYYSSSQNSPFDACAINTASGMIFDAYIGGKHRVCPFLHIALAPDFQKEDLNESYNFDLDNDIEDVSISDTIYPIKQKINKDSLQKDKDQIVKKYLFEHPKVKVGDILYDNYIVNEKNELLSLGDNSGKPKAICAIQSDFLPDKQARFISVNYKKRQHGPAKGLLSLQRFPKIISPNNTLIRPGYNSFQSNNELSYSILIKGQLSNPYTNIGLNPSWLTPNQALSDLQGWINTKLITDKLDGSSNYAAWECIREWSRLNEENLWYLPTIGELGIMMAKLNDVNRALISIGKPTIDDEIWSSTQHSSKDFTFYSMSAETGLCTFEYRYAQLYVYPFIHFTVSDDFNQINESYNFDLDNDIEDVSISNTIYPTKQKINKASLQHDKEIYLESYIKKQVAPQLTFGMNLYANFKLDEQDRLENLGDKSANIIAKCAIPYGLPDNFVRFNALNKITCAFKRKSIGNAYLNDNKSLTAVLNFYNESNQWGYVNIGNIYHSDCLKRYLNKDNKTLDVQNYKYNYANFDFKGKENCQKLLKLYNSCEAVNYCNQYCTEGTNEGDWYLPAIGELGLYFEQKLIHAKFLMSEHGYNISSTIFDSSNIWCLDTAASFRMQNHPMAMTEYAIPFIQFKLSPNFKV